MREVAPVEGHRRGHLRRDAVRGLQERRQGQLPGRLRRSADAAATGQVVPDRDSVGRVLVRPARTARHLPQGRAHGRLDHEDDRGVTRVSRRTESDD